ncbi:MAG: hypothetical protein MI921_00220 [Cytophagales bacterium]|nr:hypothetical protein [Cytophagales bacterium]
MKQLILLWVLLSAASAKVQEQITKENFENHDLGNVTFLMSEARYGNFIYIPA